MKHRHSNSLVRDSPGFAIEPQDENRFLVIWRNILIDFDGAVEKVNRTDAATSVTDQTTIKCGDDFVINGSAKSSRIDARTGLAARSCGFRSEILQIVDRRNSDDKTILIVLSKPANRGAQFRSREVTDK